MVIMVWWALAEERGDGGGGDGSFYGTTAFWRRGGALKGGPVEATVRGLDHARVRDPLRCTTATWRPFYDLERGLPVGYNR